MGNSIITPIRDFIEEKSSCDRAPKYTPEWVAQEFRLAACIYVLCLAFSVIVCGCSEEGYNMNSFLQCAACGAFMLACIAFHIVIEAKIAIIMASKEFQKLLEAIYTNKLNDFFVAILTVIISCGFAKLFSFFN